MESHNEKFKALVHYICYKAQNPSILGATKLNKVLWYSDSYSYLTQGRPITDEKYIKRQFGPVPKHILKTLGELSEEGSVKCRPVDFHGFRKDEYIAFTSPDLSFFSAEEISLIDEVFDVVCNKHTASSISQRTHNDIWKLAIIGEEIPLHTIFASILGEIDKSDIVWAESVLENAA